MHTFYIDISWVLIPCFLIHDKIFLLQFFFFVTYYLWDDFVISFISKTKPVRNKPFVAEFLMMVSITSTLNKNQQNHWSHVNFIWNNKWTKNKMKKKREKIQFHSCFWQRTSFLITFMSHLICDTNDGKLKETNYI